MCNSAEANFPLRIVRYKYPVHKNFHGEGEFFRHQGRFFSMFTEKQAIQKCQELAMPSGNFWVAWRGTGPYTAEDLTALQGPDFQNIWRLSYDNAKVTIDLRRMSNLQNILRRKQGFSYVGLRFTCVDSVPTLAYDITRRNLSML